MKRLFYFFLLFTCFQFSVTGQEPEEAVDLDALLSYDVLHNFDGGIKKGTAGMGLINMLLTIDTKKAGLWKGGTFHINMHKLFGDKPSADLIGDIQVVSNIEGETEKLLFEAWYKQQFGNFSALAGLHNFNSEFFVSSNAGLFINSSFGAGAFLSLNNYVSIYPLTTLAFVGRYDIEQFSFLTGIYNHGEDFVSESSFRLKNHLFRQGFISVAEVQLRPEGWEGEYKFGTTYRRCTDKKLLYNTLFLKENSFGVYFLGDQQLIEINSRFVNAFCQFGYNSLKYNPSPIFFSAGINMKGLFTGEVDEEIGLAFLSARLNNELDIPLQEYLYTGNESVIELSAKYKLHEKIIIHPDIQYVLNPSGNSVFNNALVGLLRLEINF